MIVKLINDILVGHNEVITRVYGEGRPADLEALPEAPNGKRKNVIDLAITDEHIEKFNTEQLNLIITMAIQIDFLFLKIRGALDGELLLDTKGLYLEIDDEGRPQRLVRWYAPVNKVTVVEPGEELPEKIKSITTGPPMNFDVEVKPKSLIIRSDEPKDIIKTGGLDGAKSSKRYN